MSMTFSGSGTITGLVAGGLPDAVVTSSDLAANAVDSQSLTLFNASGSAPVYACRAWVNFNGTGTVAIRASGNVSSITDNSAGNFTINFTSALVDVNYSVVGTGSRKSGIQSDAILCLDFNTLPSTTAVRINTINTDSTSIDGQYNCVSIFR